MNTAKILCQPKEESLFIIKNENILYKDSKTLLDKMFPLNKRSHKDVVSYQIDYCHLVAYFKDGMHTGLKKQSLFLGYKGKKESPDTILFINKGNSYLELTLDLSTNSNKKLNLTKIKGINIISTKEDYTLKNNIN